VTASAFNVLAQQAAAQSSHSETTIEFACPRSRHSFRLCLVRDADNVDSGLGFEKFRREMWQGGVDCPNIELAWLALARAISPCTTSSAM
jgi:hypothetical protein